jgi:hypothetical protein
MTKDEALDLALEVMQIKSTLSAFGPDEGVTFTQDTWAKLHAAMSAVVAQQAPVQEPFGYVYEVYCLPECAGEMDWVESFDRYEPDAEDNIRNVIPVYTTPPAQPAPAPGYCKHCKQYSIEEPPPAAQRQWVGLTDEEIKDIVEECDGVGWDVAQAIEAKLKEKNT